MLGVLRETRFGTPLAQTVHLVGITVVLGTMLAMNIRLLDLGYRALPAETFLPELWKWFRRGLWLTMSAGLVVFIPDPVRYAQSVSFRVKMATLAIAILFSFTVFRKELFFRQDGRQRSARTVAVSVASLFLWFGVGWCGRAIAFVG